MYLSAQVMLGVDRLDMIKGIPQKLLAFEKFLEENPEWRDKVLLVQIAVPSRTDVPEYQARFETAQSRKLARDHASCLHNGRAETQQRGCVALSLQLETISKS